MHEIFPITFAVSAGNPLTETLATLAGVAFLATALWVVVTMLKESANKERVSAVVDQQLSRSQNVQEERKNGFDKELEQMNKEYEEFYKDLLESAKMKLSELTMNAQSALGNVSRSYAKYCLNQELESHEAIGARYLRSCEQQWSFFKAELGYVSVKDVEPHLRMILNAQELLDQMGSESDDESLELNPSMARILEVRNLSRNMPSERMGHFQMETIEAIDPFIYFYDNFIREWVGECSYALVAMVRKKGQFGVTIKDTDFKPRLVRFKNVIDTVSKLCERMQSNSQQVGEEEAAFNQIVFGSTVLSIIASLQDWFPELGVPKKTDFQAVSAAIDENRR